MPAYARELNDEEDIDPNEEIVVPENSTPEEKTFAKRYGDLRRLTAKVQGELKSTKEQLMASTGNNLNLPNSTNEADIDEWMDKYPQVAAIVTGIANRQANQATEQIKTRVQELDDREAQLKEEAAKAKVVEAHPDFDEIADDHAFHTWLGEQSQLLQDAIYVNSTDFRTAISVIGMYKAENGKAPSTKPNKGNKPSESDFTPSRRAAPIVNKEVLFRESQIQRMSPQEYEAKEKAIEQAWREGKVMRDLSGGAS